MKRARPRWQCIYCPKSYASQVRTLAHELSCFKNPHRRPFPGELTHVFATGKMKNFDIDADDYPAGMEWFEWVEHEDMPPWWPGIGKMWTGMRWVDVPGHAIDWPKGAHGCAGGPEPFDVWPQWHGEPLNELETGIRLELRKEGWPFDPTCSTGWWEAMTGLVAPGIAPPRPPLAFDEPF